MLIFVFLTGCASIPLEFQSAMETEARGIEMMYRRHNQTVRELVDNWHKERMARLTKLKQSQIKKKSILLPNPNGGEGIEVVPTDAILILENHYDSEVRKVNQVRTSLIDGYLDEDNWNKLKELHSVNLDMTKSLLELNQAQKSFYQSIVGKNTPSPSELINTKIKNFLSSEPQINK